MRLLVEHGADLDARDALGGSACTRACATENFATAMYLYERGADVRLDEGTEDGKVLGATCQNFLGDHLLAHGRVAEARVAYAGARRDAAALAEASRRETSRRRWKTAGLVAVGALLGAAQSYAASYQGAHESLDRVLGCFDGAGELAALRTCIDGLAHGHAAP